MKTLEEVKKYLNEVGHSQFAIHKIEGFLLGNGMLGKDYEMEYMIGGNDFDDFMNWFNGKTKTGKKFDDDEFQKGDFIHVEKGIDVICLSDVFDGKFVGTNGTIIHKYEFTNESRPCDEKEMQAIKDKLKEQGVCFCFECDELEPLYEKEVIGEYLDELEIRCKESIENIFANLHGGDLKKVEKDMLVGCMESLCVLGKEYE